MNFYKKLIHYRNTSLPLTQGDIEDSGITVSEIVSFTRKFKAQEELIIHNVSDVEVTLKLDGENKKFDDVAYASTDGFILKEGELKLPAFSTVILK